MKGTEQQPSKLDWPSLPGRNLIATAIAIVSALLSSAGYFVAPYVASTSALTIVQIGLAIIIVVCLVIFATMYAIPVSVVAIRRIQTYPSAWLHIIELRDSLTLSNNQLIRLASMQTHVEICKIMYDRHVYISILRQNSIQLQIGNRLLVYDKEEFRPMGAFEVIEERTSEYYACHTDIDALWLGYLRDQGQHDMVPPPYMRAILITEGAAR